MPIFLKTDHDLVTQVDDKLRISAAKSFSSKGEPAITNVEIEPEAGAGFTSVFAPKPSDWFLDWQYETSGEKTITLRVTAGMLGPVTKATTINVLTEAEDLLLSNDQDLVAIEGKMLGWIPDGRNSFKYAHREAQKQILEWLWTNGFKKFDGSRIGKAEILDVEEFRFWSKYLALRLIFKEISNSVDDIFDKKSKSYQNDEFLWRSKAALKLDLNGDGDGSDFESLDLSSRNLVRT
jgi:hypothetical protein